MALGAATVWRVRVSGNDANGAGYDSSVSGAGTDYSQQDAAQAAASLGTSTNSTTFTDIGGLFTSAMVGNILRIASGTGATVGYYTVMTYVDANTVTLVSVSGTYTAGVWSIGGAAAGLLRMSLASNATGDKVVPGNVVYVRGAGSDSPSSNDYTISGTLKTLVSGDTTSGRIKWISENGRARIIGDGNIVYQGAYQWFEGFYFAASAGTFGSQGIIQIAANSLIKNCVIDMSNMAGLIGLYIGYAGNNPSIAYDCEVYGGTTSPSFSSGCHGIFMDYYNSEVQGCFVHHCRDTGVKFDAGNGGGIVQDNLIYACAGDGIGVTPGTLIRTYIKNNVVDANGGHAINITTATNLEKITVVNNIFSNHVGASKYGINLGAGTILVNDKRKGLFDYNCLYNNTGNYNAISAGAHDQQNINPQYVNAAAYNWAQGTNLKALGWPGLIRKSTTTWFVDIGVQRQEAGSSGPIGQIVGARSIGTY